MAATNTPPPPSTGNNSSLAQQLLHKPAFKKLAVIIVTFIPAFIGLSIINVIFTNAFVLSSYLFVTTTTTPAAGSSLASGGGVIGIDSNVAAIPKRAKEQGSKKQATSPMPHTIAQNANLQQQANSVQGSRNMQSSSASQKSLKGVNSHAKYLSGGNDQYQKLLAMQ